MGLLDFLTGGSGTDAADAKPNSSDATGSYLGNLVDPTTTPQYLKARQQEAGLNFFANMAAASGPSRLPVPFGSVIGAATLGMEKGLGDLSSQTLQAAQTSNQIQDNALKKIQGAGLVQQMGLLGNASKLMQAYYGAGGDAGTAPGAAGTPGTMQPMPSKAVTSLTTADTSMLPEQRALLDTIAGPESSGAYNIRWNGPKGGATFDSYDQHPNIPVMGPDGKSTAAGRYQFVYSTWKPIADELGLKDFSQVNQDKAGWYNASTVYQQKTGRDLLTDLKAGRLQDVAPALKGQWATLAGAMPTYATNLAKYASPAVASAAPGSVSVPVGGLLGAAASGSSTTTTPGAQPAASAGGDAPHKGGITVDGNWYPNAKAWNIAMDAKSASVGPGMKGDAGVIVNGQWAPTPAPAAPAAPAQGGGGTVPVARPPVGLLGMAPGASQAPVAAPTGAPPGLMAAAAQGGPPMPVAPPQAPPQMPMPSAPPAVVTAQAGAPSAGAYGAPSQPQMQPSQMQTMPPMPQQQLLPPGVTPERIKAAAGLAAALGLAKLPIPPDVKQMAEYPLAAALAQQNAYSTQAADVAGAGPKAANTATAQDPHEMVQVILNGQKGMMPRDQYMREMATYNPLTGRTASGAVFGERVLDPLANLDPNGYNFSPKVGQGPGQNAPLPVPNTVDHPYSTEIPPLSSQAPLRMSGAVAPDVQKGWIATSQKLADAQEGIQVSKQLLSTMAGIFQRYESGSFAEWQSDAVAKLNALGIPTPKGINTPEDMQQLLKDNFVTALATMKATGIGRFTQLELKMAQQNFANPNIKPGANFAIMTQDFGKVLQAEAMSRDWTLAHQAGWSDPNSFATQWYARPTNDLQNFVARAAVQFGPFKGMSADEQKQQIPQTGNSPNGRVMRLPSGKVVPL